MYIHTQLYIYIYICMATFMAIASVDNECFFNYMYALKISSTDTLQPAL